MRRGEEIPAFVAPGTLLALLPEAIDTLAPEDRADVVGLGDVGDDRELWLWPGGASALAEADGLAYAWSAEAWDGAIDAATTATWNGEPVEITDRAIAVIGAGQLVVAGAATLDVEGGAADRGLLVRLR